VYKEQTVFQLGAERRTAAVRVQVRASHELPIQEAPRSFNVIPHNLFYARCSFDWISCQVVLQVQLPYINHRLKMLFVGAFDLPCASCLPYFRFETKT